MSPDLSEFISYIASRSSQLKFDILLILDFFYATLETRTHTQLCPLQAEQQLGTLITYNFTIQKNKIQK